MNMNEIILQYLLDLSTTVILPAAVWIVASSRIFRRRRIFSPETYQEEVHETVCNTAIENICQLLHQIYSQNGMIMLISNTSLETIVRNLTEGPDRLTALSTMYQSLVESGTQSPFFVQIAHGIYVVIVGGG